VKLKRSALAGVTSLATAAFAGSSWYFAGKIRSEALAVRPGAELPAYDDAQVMGLPPGHVLLRAIGDQPALFKPQRYGIAWEGGFGCLGASAAVSGGAVTRPLTLMHGPAPEEGQFVGLERAYFLGDVAVALGIPVRDIEVDGPHGKLPAWYFPGRGRTFVICVHGQNGTRKDVLRIVSIVHGMGFPALAVTYRNDLGVAPDSSGYVRYGQMEWCDIEAAVRCARAYGAERVILAGQSMGGGVVAAFLKNSALAKEVVRVLLDAPMLDLRAAIDYQVIRHTSPMAGRVLAPMVWAAMRIAGVRFGVDWRATSYLGDTTWLKVPTLVTHGDDDTRVPVSTSARLKALRPSLVSFERFPGAGHLESWNIDRVRYTSAVEAFLAPVA
jgi:alpha-beta hydrolase superfamily lysophospholipase